MQLIHSLDREERVSEPFGTGGRRVEVRARVLPFAYVKKPQKVDQLMFSLERRATPDDDFEEIKASAWLAQNEEAAVVFDIPAVPLASDRTPVDEMPRMPMYRVRVTHLGQAQPRFAITVV